MSKEQKRVDASNQGTAYARMTPDEERRSRIDIWERLHLYAHGTGALAGDDVAAWFIAQSEKAWRKGSPL